MRTCHCERVRLRGPGDVRVMRGDQWGITAEHVAHEHDLPTVTSMKITTKSGAVVGAMVVATLVAASAASISLTSTGVGAGTEVVAACDSSIAVDYVTAYATATQTYNVTAVKLLGLTACSGLTVSLALDNGAGGGSLLSEPGTVIVLTDQNADSISDDFLFTLSAPVDASAITNLAVVIG